MGDGAGSSDGNGGGEAIEEGGEAEKVVAVAVGDVDVCEGSVGGGEEVLDPVYEAGGLRGGEERVD